MAETNTTGRSQSLQLLGIEFDGPPPAGRTYMRMRDSGVYVLYGANGAGKTRLLKAIDRAFSGRRTGGLFRVHLQAESPSQVDATAGGRVSALRNLLARRVPDRWERAPGPNGGEWEEFDTIGEATSLTEIVRRILDYHPSDWNYEPDKPVLLDVRGGCTP